MCTKLCIENIIMRLEFDAQVRRFCLTKEQHTSFKAIAKKISVAIWQKNKELVVEIIAKYTFAAVCIGVYKVTSFIKMVIYGIH